MALFQHGHAWPDLFHHVLAHIPVSAADPTSLHAPRWIRLSAEHLTADPARFILHDAAPLAEAYAATAQAHVIQGFVTSCRTVEAFTAHSPAQWAQRSGLSSQLADLLEWTLILARDELSHGFLEARKSWTHRFNTAELLDGYARLTQDLPALWPLPWLVSAPLLDRGRLHSGGTVMIGAPCVDLGVSVADVLVQGCHESCLAVLLSCLTEALNGDPSGSGAGRVRFEMAERAAADLNARVLRGSWVADAYLRWRHRYSMLNTPAPARLPWLAGAVEHAERLLNL